MSEELTFNGYVIPGGWGGVGVRKACEIVIANPGIKQIDLFTAVLSYTGLHGPQAGWLVTPRRGPAETLWSRKKIGRSFHCYPNEFTHLAIGAEKFGKELWLKHQYREYKKYIKFELNIGDLVCVENAFSERLALFSGWTFYRGRSITQVFKSFEEMVDFALPAECECGWSAAYAACSNSDGFFEASMWKIRKVN